MYGRNELFAQHIAQKTNKVRTRKQVSSHIQARAKKTVKDAPAGAIAGLSSTEILTKSITVGGEAASPVSHALSTATSTRSPRVKKPTSRSGPSSPEVHAARRRLVDSSARSLSSGSKRSGSRSEGAGSKRAGSRSDGGGGKRARTAPAQLGDIEGAEILQILLEERRSESGSGRSESPPSQDGDAMSAVSRKFSTTSCLSRSSRGEVFGMGTDDEEEDVWSGDVERAFLEAARLYPKGDGRTKVVTEDGESLGRNALISRFIYRQTGRQRSRKQVSSHLQVLARRQSKVAAEDDDASSIASAARPSRRGAVDADDFGELDEDEGAAPGDELAAARRGLGEAHRQRDELRGSLGAMVQRLQAEERRSATAHEMLVFARQRLADREHPLAQCTVCWGSEASAALVPCGCVFCAKCSAAAAVCPHCGAAPQGTLTLTFPRVEARPGSAASTSSSGGGTA